MLKKYISFLLLLLCSFLSYGQRADTSGNVTQANVIRGGQSFMGYLQVPNDTLPYTWFAQSGRIAVKNGILLYNTGSGWITPAAGSNVISVNGFTGVVSLTTTNIPEGTNKYFTDARVYADSTVFLAYVKSLIGLKLNFTDTAAMLGPYLRSAVAGATYQPLLGYTAENVANKATNFGTINNTLYPTTAAVNNLVNSSLAGYMPIADSNSLSLGYVTITWGNSHYYPLSTNPAGYLTASSITGKVNYTDTASMLSPYLHKADSSFNGGYMPWWYAMTHFLTSYSETDPLSFHRTDSNTVKNPVTYSFYYNHLPTGLPPTGTAGGSLTGSYPNPTIANGAVTGSMLANGAVDFSSAKVTGNLQISNFNSGMSAGLGTYWDGSGEWAALPAAYTAGRGLGSTGSSYYADTTVLVKNVVIKGSGILHTSPSVGINTLGMDTVTLSLITQSPNYVFAGPATGTVNATPTFRALTAADIPALAYLTGNQTITFTGDVTGSGAISVALTLNAQYKPQVITVTTNPTSYAIASSYANIESPVYIFITGQSNNITFGAPTGSWTLGQKIEIYITDGGSAVTVSWNADFIASTTMTGVSVPLPTTTVAGKICRFSYTYIGSTTWMFNGGLHQ